MDILIAPFQKVKCIPLQDSNTADAKRKKKRLTTTSGWTDSRMRNGIISGWGALIVNEWTRAGCDSRGNEGEAGPRPWRNKNNYHNYKNHPATVSVSHWDKGWLPCHTTTKGTFTPCCLHRAYHSCRRHSSRREPRPVPRRGSNRLQSPSRTAACLPLRAV